MAGIDLFIIILGVIAFLELGCAFYLSIKFIKERKSFGIARGSTFTPLIILFPLSNLTAGIVMWGYIVRWAPAEYLIEILGIAGYFIIFNVLVCITLNRSVGDYDFDWYVKGTTVVSLLMILANGGIIAGFFLYNVITQNTASEVTTILFIVQIVGFLWMIPTILVIMKRARRR